MAGYHRVDIFFLAKLLPVNTHAGGLGSYNIYVDISALPNLEFSKARKAPQRRKLEVRIKSRSSELKTISKSNKLQSSCQHIY